MKSVAEVQLVYKSKVKKEDRIKVKCSGDAEKVFRSKFDENTIEMQETFGVLYMNRANEIIGYYELAKGGIAGCVVDKKLLFATAIKCLASGVILCHNHPSGQLSTSSQDRQITKECQEIGKLLDCQVLDHIILTATSYLSFADDCLL